MQDIDNDKNFLECNSIINNRAGLSGGRKDFNGNMIEI